MGVTKICDMTDDALVKVHNETTRVITERIIGKRETNGRLYEEIRELKKQLTEVDMNKEKSFELTAIRAAICEHGFDLMGHLQMVIDTTDCRDLLQDGHKVIFTKYNSLLARIDKMIANN